MSKKSTYKYLVEVVNMASGQRKDVQKYNSPIRLKIDHIYFSLPGLPIGGYRVVKEIEREDADEE